MKERNWMLKVQEPVQTEEKRILRRKKPIGITARKILGENENKTGNWGNLVKFGPHCRPLWQRGGLCQT